MEARTETRPFLDFSRLGRLELIGAICAVIALVSLFFLPWYTNTSPIAQAAGADPICDAANTECTGWETFPILRWILLIGVAAPLLLAWVLVRNHKLSWAPGEMTMVGAFAGLTLIAYNGLIDKPGSGPEETGVSLEYGYWIALLVGLGMATTAFLRAMEAGGAAKRKAPGNV